jgi:hypothetical protein
MPIGNGGIIGPANVPTITTASGVWSLREQQQAQSRGAWPSLFTIDVFSLGGGAGGKVLAEVQEAFLTRHLYPCQQVCRIPLLLVLEGLLPITVMIRLLVDLILHLLLVLVVVQEILELTVMMVDQVAVELE